MPKPIVLIDTREKRPLAIPESWKSLRSRLDCYDYSAVGLQHIVGVERKSIDDLFATLTWKKSKARFLRQIDRAKKQVRDFYVLVQGSLEDVAHYQGRSRGRANQWLVLQYLYELSIEHDFRVMLTDMSPITAGRALTRLFDSYRKLIADRRFVVKNRPSNKPRN